MPLSDSDDVTSLESLQPYRRTSSRPTTSPYRTSTVPRPLPIRRNNLPTILERPTVPERPTIPERPTEVTNPERITEATIRDEALPSLQSFESS